MIGSVPSAVVIPPWVLKGNSIPQTIGEVARQVHQGRQGDLDIWRAEAKAIMELNQGR